MSKIMNYPASTLAIQKGKWYVFCTIPTELRAALGNRKQLKRSTGTSDQNQARQKQHQITTEIYSEFDRAGSSGSPVYKAMEAYLLSTGLSEDHTTTLMNTLDLSSPTALEDLMFNHRGSPATAEPFQEAKMVYEAVREENPSEAPVTSPDAVLFSAVTDAHQKDHKWNREKTKKAAMRACEDFMKRMGDLPVQDVTKKMVYDYGKSMDADGLATKTIRTRVGFVSRVFTHAEMMGLIESNPFTNVRLSGLGVATESWKKFEDQQLIDLFKQNLPSEVRLALSILITTGMRLDEVVLLSHEDIKTSNGIKHFDLTGSLVKNKGSERLIPIVPELDAILPKSGTGRLFSYTVNADGKASTPASNDIMPWIRNITSNPKQVVHSLRGTLKDLLRDVGVSKEVNDFITGHAGGDAAGKYGSGPSLQARKDALELVDHKWL